MMTSALLSQEKNTDTFSYKVGNYEVILLSENQGKGNTSILVDATPEMIQKAIPDGTFANAVNTFLVKTPGKVYLIDTGFGKNLFKNMQSVGVTPEQINTLIITHMHGDHIGGMLKDGKVTFPNSEVILAEVERNYWANATNELAKNVLREYNDKLNIIRPDKLGSTINGDGFYFIEAYGHTPGHICCLIKSGNEQLMVWADLTHAMAIQMPYPEVAVTYDTDPKMAVKSRKAVLEYVAKNKIPVAGMHVPYPGIGRVEALKGGGYKFIPAK